MENDGSVTIVSKSEIPLGHKIAMIDFNEGDTILKYGHDIGKVVKPVSYTHLTLPPIYSV